MTKDDWVEVQPDGWQTKNHITPFYATAFRIDGDVWGGILWRRYNTRTSGGHSVQYSNLVRYIGKEGSLDDVIEEANKQLTSFK